MRITHVALVAALGALVFGGLAVAQNPADWPAVAGDIGAMKYSPADQITPANVAKLTQAWTYQTGGPAPIVVNNVAWISEPSACLVLERFSRKRRNRPPPRSLSAS